MLKLATFFPYLRSRFDFVEGDRSGSFTAHQDLLVQSLRSGVVDEALVFAELWQPGPTPLDGPRHRIADALQHLEAEIRVRVRVEPISWFQSANAHETPLVLVGKFTITANSPTFAKFAVADGRSASWSTLCSFRTCSARA